jgi:transposase
MQQLINSVAHAVPTALSEIITLGRTLKKRAADVLAYFNRPGTSNGPTEAINGRLEHLRGSALGFRNLTNYIARSLLETGGFRPDYTLDREEPVYIRRLYQLQLLYPDASPSQTRCADRARVDTTDHLDGIAPAAIAHPLLPSASEIADDHVHLRVCDHRTADLGTTDRRRPESVRTPPVGLGSRYGPCTRRLAVPCFYWPTRPRPARPDADDEGLR